MDALPEHNNRLSDLSTWLQSWQADTMHMLEALEATQRFERDAWSCDDLGGGVSCVLQGGDIIEKAGVNFSHIRGKALPASANPDRQHLEGQPFEALGVSIVVHPNNPFIPTTHANCRFFQSFAPSSDDNKKRWWFGGGIDLTPYYGDVADCVAWHSAAKKACDAFQPGVYEEYKAWCDRYFYLPHRQEARGIGGLFFDDVNNVSFEACFGFIQQVAAAFNHCYAGIVARHKSKTWTAQQKAFQQYRRGRYVEFNLLYDRGTLFGLQSNGRTESILMSMPPSVSWPYQWQAAAGSVESQLISDFLTPKDWLALAQLEQHSTELQR